VVLARRAFAAAEQFAARTLRAETHERDRANGRENRGVGLRLDPDPTHSCASKNGPPHCPRPHSISECSGASRVRARRAPASPPLTRPLPSKDRPLMGNEVERDSSQEETTVGHREPGRPLVWVDRRIGYAVTHILATRHGRSTSVGSRTSASSFMTADYRRFEPGDPSELYVRPATPRPSWRSRRRISHGIRVSRNPQSR
jgi:hypothetical protein